MTPGRLFGVATAQTGGSYSAPNSLCPRQRERTMRRRRGRCEVILHSVPIIFGLALAQILSPALPARKKSCCMGLEHESSRFPKISGVVPLGLHSIGLPALQLDSKPQSVEQANVTLRIAPISAEIGPGRTIKTVGYNGSIPGPILRFREGKPVTVDVFNDTDVAETVHWHGQRISSGVDGSVEEGTPAVPPHGHRRYRFTPAPAGTRWYHTHSWRTTI